MLAKVVECGETKATLNVDPSLLPRAGDYIEFRVESELLLDGNYRRGRMVSHVAFEYSADGTLREVCIVVKPL